MDHFTRDVYIATRVGTARMDTERKYGLYSSFYILTTLLVVSVIRLLRVLMPIIAFYQFC